jgi:hypothetical protein
MHQVRDWYSGVAIKMGRGSAAIPVTDLVH